MNAILALSVAAALVAACSGGLVNHGLHYGGGATSYQNVHIESHGSVPVPVAAAHHGGYGGGHGIALADAGHGLELGGGLIHHDGGLGLGAIAGGHEFAGHLEGGYDGGYGGGYGGGFHH